MEKGIALVTATPPSFNPGMSICQANARSFIRRKALSSKTRFLRLVHLDQRLAGIDDIKRSTILARADVGNSYELFESTDQLEGYVPLYWGDFLHMHLYL